MFVVSLTQMALHKFSFQKHINHTSYTERKEERTTMQTTFTTNLSHLVSSFINVLSYYTLCNMVPDLTFELLIIVNDKTNPY